MKNGFIREEATGGKISWKTLWGDRRVALARSNAIRKRSGCWPNHRVRPYKAPTSNGQEEVAEDSTFKHGRLWGPSHRVVPDSYISTDRSLPGSSVHRTLHVRVLEKAAISFSSQSSWPRKRTQSPAMQADSLPTQLWGSLGDYVNANVNRDRLRKKDTVSLYMYVSCKEVDMIEQLACR